MGQGGEIVRALRAARVPCTPVIDVPDLLHRLHRERADVVLVDGESAGTDAIGALEAVAAALKPGQMLPVMLLGAGASPEERQRARDAGASDFIPRGLEGREIAARLGAWVHAKRTHDALMEARARLAAAELAADQAAARLAMPALPALKGWNVEARTHHGGRFGCDFCIVHEAPGGNAALFVGEITGDRPQCILALGAALGVLRTGVDLGLPIASILALANRRLLEHGEQAGMLTAHAALLPRDGSPGEHARAGCPDPLLWAEGADAPAPAGLPAGPPLGVDESSAWTPAPLDLPPGARLATATNGLEGALGPDALASTLATLGRVDLGEAADFLDEQLEAARPLADAATFLLLERLG